MNKHLIEFKRKEKYWNELKKSIPINEFREKIEERYGNPLKECNLEARKERSKKISWERAVFINEWLTKLNAQRDLLPYRVLHGIFWDKRMLSEEDKLIKKYDIHKKYQLELIELQKQKGILPMKEYNEKLKDIKQRKHKEMNNRLFTYERSCRPVCSIKRVWWFVVRWDFNPQSLTRPYTPKLTSIKPAPMARGVVCSHYTTYHIIRIRRKKEKWNFQ